RGAPSRTSAKSSAPVPKGARIPRPALLYWIARAIFIGSLILFFASPSLLNWAVAHRPLPTPAGQRGGLLTGLLTNPHPTPTPTARRDTSPTRDAATTEATPAIDARPDPIAPLLASAVIAVVNSRIVADLGKLGT